MVSGLGAWQTPRVTDAEIARLMAQLGDGSGDVAEEAKASHGVWWRRHERLDQERDWDAPWARLVADAREAALLEAEFIPRCENLVATVEWIDESDR